jgi:hypothetical protein
MVVDVRTMSLTVFENELSTFVEKLSTFSTFKRYARVLVYPIGYIGRIFTERTKT